MNTMSFIVWMLPIMFVIHDFEEIIMAEVWGKRHRKEINAVWPKKQPFGLNYVENCHTPVFAIGVLILFALCIYQLTIIFCKKLKISKTFVGKMCGNTKKQENLHFCKPSYLSFSGRGSRI